MMMMSNYGFPVKTEYMINETAELIIPDNSRHNTSVGNSNIEVLSSVVVKTEPLDPIIVKTETIDPIVFLCGEENSRDSVESQVKYKHKHLTNATDIFNEDSSSEELPVLFEDVGEDLTDFSEVFKPNIIKYNKNKIEKSLSSSHKCEYCDYVTASSLCLRQHIKNGCHLRFKTFKCFHCDYSVHGRRRTMDKHIELHSSEMAITCDYCSFLASTPFSITLHYQKVHQNQLKPPSMLQNHFEPPSMLLNQFEPPSKLLNQFERPSVIENQLESPTMLLNRLENSSKPLNKLESRLNSDLNKLESPSKQQNLLELHSSLVNQFESLSTGLNQLESSSMGLNQTESPLMGLNQWHSPSTGLNRLEPPSAGINQSQATIGLTQLEPLSTPLNWFVPPSTSGVNKLGRPSKLQNRLEFNSWHLQQLEPPSLGLNQLESPSKDLNQLESQGAIDRNHPQLSLSGLNGFEPPSLVLSQLEPPSMDSDFHSPYTTQHPSTGSNKTSRPPEIQSQWMPLSTNVEMNANVEVLPLSDETPSITLSFKCHLCPFITYNKRLLMRHFHQRHEKRNYHKLKRSSKFKCNLCNYQSFQTQDFQIHSRTCPNKEGRDSWKSKICDYSILYREGMLKTTHRRFKCEHCDYICKQKDLLKYHLTSIHNLKGHFVKGFKCFRCNERFKNKIRVKVHCRKALILNETQPSRPRKNYRCLFCVFHTKSKNFFSSHFRSKHRNNGLKCAHCKSTFKYLNILHRHLSTYHNFCKLCNVGFPNKRTLINHEPIHNRKCYVTMKKLLPRFSVPSVILCLKKIKP